MPTARHRSRKATAFQYRYAERMVDLLFQTFVGVAAGVLTSALMFFIKDLWIKTLRPYIEELRYQGVTVAGTWRGFSRDEFHDSDAALILQQSAQKITGTFSFRFRSAVKQFTVDYQVTGYIWEGYLTLNFRPTDKGVTTSATALFKIAGGGSGLVGQFVFRNTETEGVTPIYLSLARVVSSAVQPGAANIPLPAAGPNPQAAIPAQQPPDPHPQPAPIQPQAGAQPDAPAPPHDAAQA
jgi:hypothetical protein